MPRILVWKVQKDREVFSTPSGLIVAERGAVVAIAVEDSFETAGRLLKAFSEYEIKPDGDK